jgi:hypothetical protein
MKDKRWRLH